MIHRRQCRVRVLGRRFTAACVCLMALLALPPAAAAAPCWLPPVPGEVIDPFREPPCPYCAGNRGIEYRVAAGTAVRAVATGVVTFSGPVAGVGYVVVRHGDGRRITYGRLAARTVDRGDRVIARMVVGRTTDRFHLGVRVGERYVDPAPMLGRLVGRPRLVPVDGTAARRPPPPRLRCGVGSAGSSR